MAPAAHVTRGPCKGSAPLRGGLPKPMRLADCVVQGGMDDAWCNSQLTTQWSVLKSSSGDASTDAFWSDYGAH